MSGDRLDKRHPRKIKLFLENLGANGTPGSGRNLAPRQKPPCVGGGSVVREKERADLRQKAMGGTRKGKSFEPAGLTEDRGAGLGKGKERPFRVS